MDSKQFEESSSSSTDSEWIEFEETDDDFECLLPPNISDPINPKNKDYDESSKKLVLPCDSSGTQLKKKQSSRKQVVRKNRTKTKKYCKKDKLLNSHFNVEMKSKEFHSTKPMSSQHSSLKAEGFVQESNLCSSDSDLNSNQQHIKLIKNNEEPLPLYVQQSFSKRAIDNDNYEACNKSNQPSFVYNYSPTEKDNNKTAELESFNIKTEGVGRSSSDSGSDSTIYSFNSRSNDKKKQYKRSISMFESANSSKAHHRVNSCSSKSQADDTMPRTYHQSLENFPNIENQRNEKKLPADSSHPQLSPVPKKLTVSHEKNKNVGSHSYYENQTFSKEKEKLHVFRRKSDEEKRLVSEKQQLSSFTLKTQKPVSVNQENRNKSNHSFSFEKKAVSIDEKFKTQYFEKTVDCELVANSAKDKKLLSNKPLSSIPETKLKNTHTSDEDPDLSMNSLDFIGGCRRELDQIAENSIAKISIKMGDLKATFQSGNVGVRNVLHKHLTNLEQQQNQFEDVINQAKNQIAYAVSRNYQDMIKTWHTIKVSVKNECTLLENFFPAYAHRKDILQSLTSKRILFLHSNSSYFFNIFVPLILLKYYPSYFIVSCECEETQKHYLKYSLPSAMKIEEQKHNRGTFVMTESELLNYILKKDYAIKKATCVVLNVPLNRSIVFDLLLSNLKAILEENKNFKLILIIDPSVDLSSYKKYFSIYETSCIMPPNLTYPVKTIWKNSSLTPKNDYLNETAQTILSILATRTWGNILVFVPSFQDAKTIYQLLKKQFRAYQYNDVKVILVEENYYAFWSTEILEQNVNSKIVFISSGSAEMITLPSVHFIVDCGIVTYYHFDHSKNVDILGPVFISTVKSKVRKSLGGIYGPGVCYRIYSKHNFVHDMPSLEYSELLRRNPLNTLIRLLKYKTDAKLHKEFVEFLPEKVIEETMETLEKFGAIEDNKVSVTGENLSKLPFEAKYSKVILLGIDFGLALETIILVAFFTEKGKVFRSTNNPKLQRIIDSQQIGLIQNQSDTLTNLHIYKICIENKFDAEWCKRHYINVNFLKKVKQRVDEMRETLFSCLEIKITESFSNEENWLMNIREIIFNCFQDNLCVFSGRLECGFRVLTSKSVAYLPTQSIICQKDNVPQFLIFDHIMPLDKNYLINVTSIPSDLVMKSLENGTLYFSCEELFDNSLTERIIQPVGDEVMSDVFLGEDDEKLKNVVEQIKLKTGSNLISIDPSVAKGSVSIYALPAYSDAAYQALNNILKVKFDEIVNECHSHMFVLTKDLNSVVFEVELVKGAMAQNVKNSTTLVQPLAEAKVPGIRSFTSAINQSNTLPYYLYISWIRRNCNGNAIVDFGKNTNFHSVRRLTMKCIQLLGTEIFMEIHGSKKNQLRISGLSANICKETLEKELKLLLPAAEITNIELLRILPFETSDKRLQTIKSLISNICKNTLNMNSTEIIVSKPKPSDIVQEALIKTNTYEGLDSVADLITIKFLEETLSVVTLTFNLKIACNTCIYRALQSRLNSVLSQLKDDVISQNSLKVNFDINIDKESEETYFIDVSATNIAVLNLVHETINCLLNGEILDESHLKDLDKIFCHGGHVWLKGLEASENIYIIMNRQNKLLRLYGAEKNCENAKKRLLQYLKDIENDVSDIIELSSEKTKNLLLKAFIQKYEIDLKQFIEECGLHQAYLDIRTAKLFVYGDETSVEKASESIQNLLENLDSIDSESIHSQESCPVCYCPAINLTYRLEHCGHLYHSEPCIQEFIENNDDFPIKCSAENCEKELVLKDIWKILRNNPERMNNLIKKSIGNFLERHVLDVVLCPAADCSMFFYKNEIGDKVRCKLCQNDICIKCHCVEHGGLTCEMYQGTKTDADYSYKIWAQTANCKRCPRCKTAIEKSEGCNHMTCRNCNGHFCWLCPTETAQVWATGNECYDHINRAHTGRLFDYNLQ